MQGIRSRSASSIVAIVLCSLLILLLGLIAVPPCAEAATVRLEHKTMVVGTDEGEDLWLDNVPESEWDTEKLFKWKSANKKIATVDPAGCFAMICGEKPGKTTVSVKYKGKTYKAKVTVKETRLDKTSLKMGVGDTYKLKIANAYDASKYKWTSSNDSVAMVSGAGKIVALREGKTTITASYSAVWTSKTKLKCTVEVGAAQAPTEPTTPTTPTEPTTPTTPTEPTTPAGVLKASSTNVSVNEGSSKDVVMTWEGNAPHAFSAASGDSSIAKISWVGDGKKYSGGYKSSLRITGVREGSTTVKVTNKSSGDVVSINVTVNYVISNKVTFDLKCQYGMLSSTGITTRTIVSDRGDRYTLIFSAAAVKPGEDLSIIAKCENRASRLPSFKWKLKRGSSVVASSYLGGTIDDLETGETGTGEAWMPYSLKLFEGSSYTFELTI